MDNTSAEVVKYEVCFVQTGDSLEEVTEILKLAFEAMDTNQLDPIWITLTDCLKINKKEPKLFVLDPFEGVAFEHLKTFHCRITGPLCILYCLQYSDVLPKRAYPVYSVSMRKVTVSCSNIPAKMRDEICLKVQLMGGFFSKDLTKSVTHLVVGEVGSQKYKVAANFGLPIMVPEWIMDVWENGQYKQLHASDGFYNKYKCPVFKGLVITVSQLSAEERLTIKSLIEENGGSYSGALKANETTHLILNEPTGDKYRFAKNWRVICVNINWIYDSIEAAYCRDEAFYSLDESSSIQPKRSTPIKDLTSCDLPLVDCSAISGHPTISNIDETMRSDVSLSLMSNKKNSYLSLDQFNLSSLPKYGQFLDGCKFFLAGFNAVHMDKLRKIVNAGGGMRFSKYSDSISHVVCGELSSDFLENLRSSSIKPFVVNFKWLLECCKNEKLIDEKPFLCMDVNTLSPEKNEVQEIKKDHSAHLVQNSSKKDFIHENITDIFKQYINEHQPEDDKENHAEKCENQSSSLKEIPDSRKNNKNTLNLKTNDCSMTEIPVINVEADTDSDHHNVPTIKENIEIENNEDLVNSENLFVGLKFVIVGFGEKDTEILSSMIVSHSGTICSEASSLCDIAVVPLIWYDMKIAVSNIVTNCWLQKCIEEYKIYDFDENELFRPFNLAPDKKPFDSFVISFSQYIGTERDCLIYLAECLGATCQEYFVRRANAAKGVLSNTHLVVSTPDGSKYEASKKWKIPAVTKQWVIDAAKIGVVPDLDRYLVETFPESLPGIEPKKPESCSTAENNEKNCMSENTFAKPTENLDHMHSKDLNIVVNIDEFAEARPVLEQEINIGADESNRNKPISEPTSNIECVHTPPQHNRIAELCNKSHRESMVKGSSVRNITENSLNISLNLDHTHNFQFHVSGILNDLDNSNNRESVEGGKRQSLPIGEMFGKYLASALRKIDDKSISEKDVDNKMQEGKSSDEKTCIFSGIVVYVSKKLFNVQKELTEIVVLLGGNYLSLYDKSCTHFVFIGKANDITKEFREARAQGKKIVSPEWIYACRDQGIRVEEDLYPHTYKANMTLSQQISILKAPSITNNAVKEITPETKEIDSLNEVKHNIQKVENINVSETKNIIPLKNNEVDFNKQLNELLVAAKSAKKRQSKRMANSSSSSPITDISPVQKLQQHLSDIYIKPTKAVDNPTEELPDTCSEHSQAYPITWDDPTGRLEREKIAARAAKTENQKHSVRNLKDDLIEVIDLDFKNPIETEKSTNVRKFMFTNISDSLKSEYIEIVKRLGGEVSDEKAFDITATHLILSNPIKNEKFLSSVASGKWVLHPQYLTDSVEENKFVNEEDYEWGGPHTDRFMQDLPTSSVKIAKCASRWRSKLQNGVILSGAFDSWKVVIHADDKGKCATYTKILESGGAEIIPTGLVESTLDKISHVFVDIKKRSTNKVDLSCYMSGNIKCVRPEYLAFYLIEDPPPDVETFLISEAKQLGSSANSKKRSTSSTSSSSRLSKRTRLKL